MLLSRNRIIAVLLLLLSTAIWGGGFVFVKWMLPYVSPMEANHLRFWLAGSVSAFLILLGPATWRQENIKATALASVLLYGMLALQTVGLKYTTVAKSGFITTLYVLFVPLILWILERRKFSVGYWSCCFAALLGIYFLADADFSNFNRGDLLTLCCALFGAAHIVAVERMQKFIRSGFAFNFYQCVFLALFGLILAPWAHDVSMGELWPKVTTFSLTAWCGLIGLGVFSSILAFSFQIYVQKSIPAHLAGLLFLLESPFAALFGYVILGESLNRAGLLGAALILCSCVGVLHLLSKK